MHRDVHRTVTLYRDTYRIRKLLAIHSPNKYNAIFYFPLFMEQQIPKEVLLGTLDCNYISSEVRKQAMMHSIAVGKLYIQETLAKY